MIAQLLTLYFYFYFLLTICIHNMFVFSLLGFVVGPSLHSRHSRTATSIKASNANEMVRTVTCRTEPSCAVSCQSYLCRT
jgi:hypothetical protein